MSENKLSAKEFVAGLKQKINDLEDVIDGKDLQILSVENDMIDTFKPSFAIFSTTTELLGMYLELIAYSKKNGWTEKANASLARIKNLMEWNKSLDSIADTNYKLKSINSKLHTHYQLLRIENKELKIKLQHVSDAENWGQ